MHVTGAIPGEHVDRTGRLGLRPKETRSGLALPFTESFDQLPDPAIAILEAARQIVRSKGYSAMTLQAVATAAGQHKASIGYYFGSKAGLVSALLESVSRDAVMEFVSQTGGMSKDERLEHYVGLMRRLAADEELTLEFLEVLPYAVRDPEARKRMAAVYGWYREANKENFQLDADKSGDSEALAALMSAVVDGLSIQAALHIDGDVISAAWAKWLALVEDSLAERGGEPG